MRRTSTQQKISVWFVIFTSSITSAVAAGATLHVDNDGCAVTCPEGSNSHTGAPTDPFCCIQDCIDASVNGDECEVQPGTYSEKIDFLGKAITVFANGGPTVTTIDATGLNDSVVKCINGEGPNTILDGFTITGGDAARGGGMRNESSNPTVQSCRFVGNSAGFSPDGGGGMHNENSSPTIACF